ncbi:hypothetical protein ACFQ9X_08285 [Catenulispora yoronensis]
MPEPVVVPEKEPEEKDNDGEISNWLHFLEGDSRADRARRRRVRLISGAVALVLLVVAGVGSWLLFGGDDGAKATQTTVLLQVKDADGNAVGNVVLVAAKTEVAGGTDAKARGAALLIPAELTVESTALDSQPFGGAMPTTSPAGKDALSALIGVDVDGVWSLDPLTFASLLNNLIGVTIDVDPASAAAVLDPSGRPVFQPGKQDMTGDKAAYYATYRPKGEAPAKQLARFGQVVDGMLARIPKQASTTAAVLDSLAAVPDPALPNDRLAAILTALGGEEQTKRFDQQALPLRADGSGVMDLDAASGVVKQLLGGAARAKDQGGLTRVSVADGTGRADTVTSRAMAASKLLGYGYTPVDQGSRRGPRPRTCWCRTRTRPRSASRWRWRWAWPRPRSGCSPSTPRSPMSGWCSAPTGPRSGRSRPTRRPRPRTRRPRRTPPARRRRRPARRAARTPAASPAAARRARRASRRRAARGERSAVSGRQ